MGENGRKGFRVVDLFAIVVACGFLLVLLIVFLDRDRAGYGGASRRIDCANRMMQLALACHMFNNEKNYLPGYVMPAGPKAPLDTLRVTWIEGLSPYLERNDLWNALLAGNQAATTVYWDQMVCPSNPPASANGPISSYCINSGQPDAKAYRMPPDYAPNGIAFNLFFNGAMMPPEAYQKQSLDGLEGGKGASYTILVTENTRPNMRWHAGSDQEAELYTTVCWQISPTPPSNPAFLINGDKDNPDPPPTMDYSRPASNHPKGVCTAFADGSVHFIRENIDYCVYQMLMVAVPQHVLNANTGEQLPNFAIDPKTGGPYILKGADY